MNVIPDYLRRGLELVIVGINPGTKSAAAGRHYAGPGNHFWPLLYESGLVSERLTHREDERVLEYGIGLTNIVDRESPSISDLSLDEMRAGAVVLRDKLQRYAPRVVAFNGKRIYEIFVGHACEVGAQTERIGTSQVFVIPSTSARVTAYQRADKLKFFVDLCALVRGIERRAVAS